MMSKARFVTGAEAGLSGEDQIVIALKVIESRGGGAQIQDIYWAVENHLGGASLSNQGKASLRRLINRNAVKAGYVFPNDVNNPGWKITEEGRRYIQDKKDIPDDGFQYPRLADVSRGIPIEALKLTARAYNSLKRAGIDTLEQLVQLSEEQILAIRNVGSLTYQEIQEKLHTIDSAIIESARQSINAQPCTQDVVWGKDIHLTYLNLSRRTFTSLIRGGIKKVSDLMILIHHDILSRIGGVGPRSKFEIYERIVEYELLNPVVHKVAESDKTSLLQLKLSDEARCYAEDLKITSIQDLDKNLRIKPLPSRPKERNLFLEVRAKSIAYGALTAAQPPEDVVDAIEGTSKSSESETVIPQVDLWLDQQGLVVLFARWMEPLTTNQRLVLLNRYGISGEKMNLQEIGDLIGVTRERVRQIEGKALRNLQNLITESTYPVIACVNSENDGLCIAPLSDLLSSRVQFAVREDHLFEIIQRELNIDLFDKYQRNELILNILKYEQIYFNNDSLLSVWCNSTVVKPLNLRLAIELIDRLLTRNFTNPMSESSLLNEATRIGLDSSLSSPEIFRKCLELCSSIEEIGVGFFCGKFEYLNNWRDQVERIFNERDEPVHYKEIARVLNERTAAFRNMPIRVRNVANRLAGDGRFVPIGKSGYWALREWGVEQSSILELMKECLEKEKRPLTQTEIYHYVDDRRPVSESSIALYLGFNDEFKKVGLDQWVLSSWPEARTLKTWDTEGVAEFLEEVFQNHGKTVLSFSDLRNHLKEAAFVSARQAQGMLNHSPAIRTFRKHGGGELLAEYQADYREIIERGHPRRRKKATLGDRIARLVRDMLEEAPDHCIPLRELVDQLVLDLERPRHTFYGYISKLEFVEKHKDQKSGETICHLVNENDQPVA